MRCLLAVVDNQLSVSRAAVALFTTQPGVSKMIRALESEIGLEVFARAGNRLTGLTDSGSQVLSLARRIMGDVSAITSLSKQLSTDATGTLRVGTTYIHARYKLVAVVRRFFEAYPGVNLILNQGTPEQILDWVVEGAIDVGVSTLPVTRPPGIVTLEAYQIERCVIVPTGHPLLRFRHLSLDQMAKYPLITFEENYSTGWIVQREFQRRGLTPRVSMRATDTNVIKAYVAAGLGVAVIQKMAVDPREDKDIRVIPSDHIFPASTTMISIRSDHLLKPFGMDFIQMIAPKWTRDALVKAC